jgi:PAS domain S-box-containing protein/putative nucleotidyltransferase with HDIG domain
LCYHNFMRHDATAQGSLKEVLPSVPSAKPAERPPDAPVRPPLSLLEAYLNLSEELFCEAGYDGFIRWLNPAWERHLGYRAEDLMDRPFVEFLHPSDVRTSRPFFREIRRMRTGLLSLEARFRGADGTYKWFSWTLRQGRSPRLFFALGREMTEQKFLEESLEQAQARMRFMQDIAESSIHPFAAGDGSGRILSCNKAFQDLLGYTEEEIIGLTWKDLTPIRHHRLDTRRHEAARRTGKVQGYEKELIRKDGSLVPVSIFIHAVAGDRDGVPIHFAFIRDISDRKQAEERLRVEKAYWERLFQSAPDAIAIESFGDLKVVNVNDRFCEFFGYSREETLGKKLNDLVVPESLKSEGERLDLRAAEDWEAAPIETRRCRKDGTLVDVAIQSVLIRDGENSLGFYTLYRDTRQMKRAEASLTESREQLRRSLERMERAWEQTIVALSNTVERKDPYTAGHQRRVSELACAIAARMGLPEDRVRGIRMAALVHDIGKINIPTDILSKPGLLGDMERSLVRTHSESGYQILRGIELPWPLADIVYQHHERLDGSGYPQGLKNGEILLDAQILAVADIVEAISWDRPYRPALGVDRALTEIQALAGQALNQEVVETCRALISEGTFTFAEATDTPLVPTHPCPPQAYLFQPKDFAGTD